MASEPFFVDANIPMYAEGKEHPYKAACSKALERIANEDLPARTSAEVLQEILHRYLSVAKGELGIHHGLPAILSADTHFDNVTQVRRIDPREF